MSLEDEVRQLVIDGERVLSTVRDRGSQKAALLPQYGLYLTVLSKSKRSKLERADEFLRVVRASRDTDAVANLELAPAGDHASLESVLGSPLRVLAAYLERWPGALVLMIESGVGSLSLFALRGGKEPLDERVVLERGSKVFVDALMALMQQQRDDMARIAREEPITREIFVAIEQAADAVWAAMPTALRTAISGAEVVLFLPSAFGDLSTFPLELVRADGGWLGATHSIARLSSMRTLLELLSPNRMPSRRQGRALIVRAEDSADLTGADVEVDAVTRQLTAMNIEVDVDRSPRVKTVRAALDDGRRVLHYCGHGFAGELGESLLLGGNEMLAPHDFSQFSGTGTPFVYLSTCEVGRSRMTTSGSAAGISTRLIEKGAPGVVGCLQLVPDSVAQAMATAFYEAAAARPAAEALTVARAQLNRYPPACWGAFVYFGDPLLRVNAGATGQATRAKTLRWDSFVGRHLAVRSPDSRQQAIDAVQRTQAADGASRTLDLVASWLETSFEPAEPEMMAARLELCREVSRDDVVAGAELRMLLAMEALQGSYYGQRKPDLVISPEEVTIGMYYAQAIHDTIAWPAFAIESARNGGIGYERRILLRMLEEAVGMLEGWQLEEPVAATLLSTAQELKHDLAQTQ